MEKQMVIPGLESLAPAEPKPKVELPTLREQIADLQARVHRLELETALVRIQLDGDKEHA